MAAVEVRPKGWSRSTCNMPIPAIIKPEILAANAKIVGAKYLAVQPPLVPPGLEATQGPGARPPVYRNVFFGAQKEWENDEVGWITVHHTRGRRGPKRAAKKQAKREGQVNRFEA